MHQFRSRDSVVGIVNSNGLDEGGFGVPVLIGSRIFSSPNVQTGSEVHPTSYPIGTRGFFPGGKVARA
jgi:hypothetical protein